MRIEKGKCLNCGAEQADLDGICCRCGWSHTEGRLATAEEIEPVRKKLTAAVEEFEKILDQHRR